METPPASSSGMKEEGDDSKNLVNGNERPESTSTNPDAHAPQGRCTRRPHTKPEAHGEITPARNMLRGTPHFEYSALESARHIRLLKVTKGYPHTTQCAGSLVHVSLEDAPAYQTVSYAWGNNKKPLSIFLAGDAELHITEGIFAALPYLISRCTTGYLWIDQICINQYDLAERGHQVAFMADIYKTAESVLVWLAAHCEHAELLKFLVSHFGLDTNGYRMHFPAYDYEDHPGRKIHAWLKGQDAPDDAARRKTVVHEMLAAIYGFPWVGNPSLLPCNQ
ncbi:hypothetical protein LTR36_009783 [Oleoguttula mirabilis]|uniref:Heterokaryon incompatibility domain-containing protein n=1 Tax=Oleoguttula mirabilis TaxID=1507867 RepID=A0AAV9J585_9PEZI|nr:hypothetical protein LTR36_009783 [Oleoguttula mirabilis]